ncbi:MAG: InlB B-repeat-containing protein, partial [Rhodoferax sp.]
MKTQYVWSVWRKLVSLLAILPLFLFAASPAHAIVFDYEANVSGLGSQQVRQTVSGETLVAQSALDQMNDWSTYTGSGALSGSKSIVTSTQAGQEWSIDFSLFSGKTFDLTSITFGEALGTDETVTLASNRGTFATCTVAGNSGLGYGTPATVCTLYGADATAMQGITWVRVTASPSNFALGFDDVTLTNIAAVPSAPTITGITPSVGQLSVAFTAGADNGTPLTNYEYSTNGGSSFTAVSPASTTSPIVITGLTNGTAYQVQIRAVNAVRKGVATASTTGTPLFPPPTATTGSASSISTTGATLNGTVNDNGVTTTMSFDYGATAGYGSSASAGTLGAGTGTTPTAVSVSGLSCNTTYHFRVNGVSSAGTTNGSDASFTTSACPLLYTVTYSGNGNTGGSAPTDATVYASNATVTVASNSGGLTRTGYTFSGWNTASDGSGTQYAAGSGSFNITASTVLYAKWVANAPSATTGSASGIGANGATLNATAIDNGLSTTVSFDYGTTAGYGGYVT